ncbi:MAG: polyphosphate--glucose phosphotransferase [Planctomycetota bacterium]
MQVLGIDIGGSAIKAAVVETTSGALCGERVRVPTPPAATPEEMARLVQQLAVTLGWRGLIGCTFPGIVRRGVIESAANLNPAWVGIDAADLFARATNASTFVLNDADAAGLAEVEFGAGRGQRGVTLLLTFGTGIGSALFWNGQLLPNTEFGHIEIRGKSGEKRAAARVRNEKDLTWKQWAARVTEYLQKIEFLLSPDLLIIGGGISRSHEKFLRYLKTRARVVPAQHYNNAGIIGAACAAGVESAPTGSRPASAVQYC